MLYKYQTVETLVYSVMYPKNKCCRTWFNVELISSCFHLSLILADQRRDFPAPLSIAKLSVQTAVLVCLLLPLLPSPP